MTIQLYNNSEPKIKLSKSPTLVDTLTGILREESSVRDPVITIERSSITGFNYAYIPEFGRYYFVTEVESVRNNLIRLHLHCDVLKSFDSGIRSNAAIISKSADKYNMLINDNSIRTYQNSLYTYKGFPSGFGSNFEYVLLVAGQ